MAYIDAFADAIQDNPKPKVNAELTFGSDLIGKILGEYVRKEYKLEVEAINFVIDPGYDDRMNYKAPGLKHVTLKVKL